MDRPGPARSLAATPPTPAGRSPARSGPLARLARAGLLCGAVDGAWAVALTLAYGRTVPRMLQGIAATVFGAGVFEAGVPGALLGLAMHLGVAFAWSSVFLTLVAAASPLRRALLARFGIPLVAAVYGPAVWIAMSGAVIPSLTGRPLVVTRGWWIQLIGHAVFVGLPIVWSIARDERADPGVISPPPAP